MYAYDVGLDLSAFCVRIDYLLCAVAAGVVEVEENGIFWSPNNPSRQADEARRHGHGEEESVLMGAVAAVVSQDRLSPRRGQRRRPRCRP